MNSAEVHAFGIEAILDHLQQKEGVTVENVNSEIGHDPQIVGKRWGLPAFIFVRTALYPNKGALSDQEFMRLLALANKHKAIAFFASVGLCCTHYPDRSDVTDEKEWGVPIRNGGFAVAYEGLLVMTTSDKFTILR